MYCNTVDDPDFQVEITYSGAEDALRAEIDPEALWKQFHEIVTNVSKCWTVFVLRPVIVTCCS